MKTPMNRFGWLVRREVWEHKGMLLWVPVAIAALMIVLTAVAVLKGHNTQMYFDSDVPHGDVIVRLGARQQQVLIDTMSAAYPLMAAPLYMAMAFMVFSYSLGALYNERRDRSILFWKSLPVSDTATVLSKVALALLLIPLGIVVLATATSLVIMAMGLGLLSLQGTNILPALLVSPRFWISPFRVLSLVPLYALWALPTVGWLLLVSSWARSKAFMWAIGAPLMTGALLAWVNAGFGLGIDVKWIFAKIISRLLISVIPGSWMMTSGLKEMAHDADVSVHTQGPAMMFDGLYRASLAALATPELIAGAIAGAAMIGAAIWLRRRREEA